MHTITNTLLNYLVETNDAVIALNTRVNGDVNHVKLFPTDGFFLLLFAFLRLQMLAKGLVQFVLGTTSWTLKVANFAHNGVFLAHHLVRGPDTFSLSLSPIVNPFQVSMLAMAMGSAQGHDRVDAGSLGQLWNDDPSSMTLPVLDAQVGVLLPRLFGGEDRSAVGAPEMARPYLGTGSHVF